MKDMKPAFWNSIKTVIDRVKINFEEQKRNFTIESSKNSLNQAMNHNII